MMAIGMMLAMANKSAKNSVQPGYSRLSDWPYTKKTLLYFLTRNSIYQRHTVSLFHEEYLGVLSSSETTEASRMSTIRMGATKRQVIWF